jgi:hypothetical protein
MNLIEMPQPRGWRQKARQFVYGMTGFEFEMQARELRGQLETAFLLLTLGDMIGVPVMPPLYALRILPYATPMISSWKRRILRERDVIENEECHLHGI